jgi:hypothetical protein
MKSAPVCARCGGAVTAPNAWTSSWVCAVHGEVLPLQPTRRPSTDGLNAVRGMARVPLWVPWPLPRGWLVTGFAAAGDDRSGGRACAVALSGPGLSGGPADLVVVAEEPGVGLGAALAGMPGPDPGTGFDAASPHARVEVEGHPMPLWAVEGQDDRAVYVGEAHGHWLWAVWWPSEAGLMMAEEFQLRDLRDDAMDFDLPFGAVTTRLP